MSIIKVKPSGFAALAFFCFCLPPASAQVKPPESATKVKQVLLYNKIGGWVHVDGSADVKAVMRQLAAAKGFSLTELADDGGITLDYLKQFQVIIWNNNTNGAASVPSTTARQAVLDYLDQGGGWFLIHGAGDHGDSWAGLRNALGTKFTSHGHFDKGDVVLDRDALEHKELKWMLEGFPTSLNLKDAWDSYQNTVRPLPGVTVIATARPIRVGTTPGLVPTADGSGDQIYGWAREVGRGRLIFNPIGHGQNQLMAQQDSIVPKLYWQNIRYAAGDFQNGCTLPWDPAFDPTARVLDPTACSVNAGTRNSGTSNPVFLVSRRGLRLRLPAPAGTLRVSLRDLGGTLVWKRTLPAGSAELALDGAVGSGVYHVEIRGATGTYRHRMALP
jgi:hypothetical protein